MLYIPTQEGLRIGQVLCLHFVGAPPPNLEDDSNPYVRVMIGQDRTSVHGISSKLYACDKNGALFNLTVEPAAVMPMQIRPTVGVDFVPVVQRNWDEVRERADDDEKYVVYNPSAELLQRLTDRNVTFRMHDGSTRVGDEYNPLYFRPGYRGFTVKDNPVREDPREILRAFAKESGCAVGDLVFVPSS